MFSILPWKPTLFFYLACVSVVLACARGFAQALIGTGLRARSAVIYTAGLVLFSYPLWYCLRQGNIEIFLFGLLALGVQAYLQGRRTLAAFCFGIAGAAKVYPLIILGLFLSERRWRYIALTLLTALVATVGSLWLINPNLRIAVRETQAGLTFANWLQFLHMNPIQGGFDHSVLGAIKRLARDLPPPARMHKLVDAYIVFFGVLGLCAYALRLRRMPVLNQVMGLITAMVTFMPLSYDYTLLHMYIPFGLLALEMQKGVAAPRPRTEAKMLICFVLLFAPLSEFIFHGTTFGGVIKTCALLALFAISIARPLESDEEELDLRLSGSAGSLPACEPGWARSAGTVPAQLVAGSMGAGFGADYSVRRRPKIR